MTLNFSITLKFLVNRLFAWDMLTRDYNDLRTDTYI